MDLRAVEHAKLRLQKAEEASQLLQTDQSIARIKSAWSDFLLAVSGIYSKLEQGAKSNPYSLNWFGRIKKERKDDQLLRYLHFARNADEHGIKEITADSSTTLYPMPDGGYAGYFGTSDIEFLSFSSVIDGKQVELKNPVTTKQVVLVKVRDDRFGDECDAPRLHEGVERVLDQPNWAALTALPYLRNLVAVAAALSQSPPTA